MADDPKYTDKSETIAELLNAGRLPAVVRVYDNGTGADNGRDVYLSRISDNTQVLLQARIKVKYGRIKVLNYYDNHAMEREKGCEYVLEHDTYVDEEFLMPLKYHGKIKFAHRPGSWRRYATIAQVLSELPRYIRIAEETVAAPLNEIGKNVTVPANSTLEVVRKFTEPDGNIRYLECSDGKTSYAFGEKDRINCTEVEDPKLYNLFELVRCKMLPKVIMFQDLTVEDTVVMDNHLNSVMSSGVQGPIELLGFVDIDVIVGWVRDKELKTYKAVLIPRGLWNSMSVQRRIHRGEEENINYIRRKYGHCNDIDFIEKSFYLMSLNQSEVTWLRNPSFYKDNLEESAHNHSDVQGQTTVLPTVKGKIGKKNTLSRLFGLSKRKDTQCAKHAGQQKESEILRRPTDPERRASKQYSFGTETYYGQTNTNTDTNWSDVQARTPESAHHYAYLDSTALPQDRDLPKIPTIPSFPVTTQQVIVSADIATETNSDEINKKRDVQLSDVHAHTATGNMLRTSACSEDNVYDEILPETTDDYVTPLSILAVTPSTLTTTYSVIEPESLTNQEGPKYLSLSRKQEEHLFREGLTKDDFFQYTVHETAYCFKHIRLYKCAEMCLEHQIDGSFFNGFDLEELKKAPFDLTHFSVLKVRKLIYDGWRPNV